MFLRDIQIVAQMADPASGDLDRRAVLKIKQDTDTRHVFRIAQGLVDSGKSECGYIDPVDVVFKVENDVVSVPWFEMKRVGISPARQLIVVAPARKAICAGSAEQVIVAGVPEKGIDPVVAMNKLRARAAIDNVVPAKPPKNIGRRIPQ